MPRARRPGESDILTRHARDALSEAVVRAPRGAAAESAVETVAFGASMYLRRGIWPLHPLCTPELVRFCARLPPDWRRGRAIERRLLARLGCSRRITHPTLQDDFTPALAQGLRSAQPLLAELFADSLLAEQHLVDGDRLLQAHDAWCAGSPSLPVAKLYAVAALELALRSPG